MLIISDVCDMIEEELNDAEKYIDKAFKYKETCPDLASTLYKLSTEEMGHADILHKQVVSLIEAYRKEHGDPPEKMQWRYEYLHSKHIEHANNIKIKQAVYKG